MDRYLRNLLDLSIASLGVVSRRRPHQQNPGDAAHAALNLDQRVESGVRRDRPRNLLQNETDVRRQIMDDARRNELSGARFGLSEQPPCWFSWLTWLGRAPRLGDEADDTSIYRGENKGVKIQGGNGMGKQTMPSFYV